MLTLDSFKSDQRDKLITGTTITVALRYTCRVQPPEIFHISLQPVVQGILKGKKLELLNP